MPVPYPPPNLIGVVGWAMVATIVVTPILSLLVLWRYRRAVRRSMHLTAPGGGQLAVQTQWQPPAPTQWNEVQGYPYPRPGGPSAPVVAIPAGRPTRASDDDRAGWTAVWNRLRSLCFVYVAGGVAYGLVAAIVWLQAGQMEFGARRLAIVAVLNAWAVVPTVLTVLAAGRRTMAVVWGSYVLLVLLLSVGSGIEPKAILALIVLMVVIPAVLLLALSGRNLRAVGPFLAVPVLIAAAGLFVWPWLALPFVNAGTSAVGARLIVTAGVLMIASTGLAYLWWGARKYAHKRASDQMLLVSQWWFLVTVWGSILLLHSGFQWALAFWLAYVTFRLVIAIGLRLRKRTLGGAPLRLLLLRVFGAQRRSEGLLRRLGASWRHLGPVQMIAGTDLAAAALEPHEFLDSLRGRLSRQFVAGADDLQGASPNSICIPTPTAATESASCSAMTTPGARPRRLWCTAATASCSTCAASPSPVRAPLMRSPCWWSWCRCARCWCSPTRPPTTTSCESFWKPPGAASVPSLRTGPTAVP